MKKLSRQLIGSVKLKSAPIVVMKILMGLRPHFLLGYDTPDQVYRTANGGGARIVDKYSESEKTHSEIEAKNRNRKPGLLNSMHYCLDGRVHCIDLNLDGRTPAETWSGINLNTKSPKQEYWFEAWDGLLAGYCLRY